MQDAFSKAEAQFNSDYQLLNKESSDTVQTLSRKENAHASATKNIPSRLTKLRNADKKTFAMNRDATIALSALTQLSGQYPGNNQYQKSLYKTQVPYEYCPYGEYELPICNYTSKYRTFNGSCNNEAFPWWGMSYTPYKRLLPALYDDGVNAPRLHSVVDGSPLPNARLIALTLMRPESHPDIWTVLFVDFSQFVFHDMSFIAAISDNQGNLYKCSCYSKSPSCLSIPIPNGDPYWQYEQCISTERSAATYKDFSCKFGEREQLNTITSWLDLSNIYGNTDADALRLRKAGTPFLETSNAQGVEGDLLPIDPSCAGQENPNACWSCGDSRCNINLGLASLNTLWVREHNRIAYILKQINPNWDDDTTYQEARRINIAGYQYMTYNEWLPIIVGDYQYKQYGFASSYGAQYSYDWDGRIFANIYNEVAGAVARFGHSMLSNWFITGDEFNRASQQFDYSELYFNSKFAYNHPRGIETFMKGCMMQPNEKVDPWVTDFVNHYLYINGSHISLPAINILRCRDHGHQPYVEYRQLCGLKPVYTFDDLDNIPPATIAQLKYLYKYVQDIDLYVGVHAELPLPNTIFGATGACILARQFQELKFGDRYWFDFGNDPHSRFRPGQLVEIKKNSIARILCDNFGYQSVLAKPLDIWDAYSNPWVSCSSVPAMNLFLWKDKSYKSYTN